IYRVLAIPIECFPCESLYVRIGTFLFVEASVSFALQCCVPTPGAPYLNAPDYGECGGQDHGESMNRFHRCDFLPNGLSASFTNYMRVSRAKTQSPPSTFYSRSHDAVIRVYDAAGNVIETHEHAGDFKEP